MYGKVSCPISLGVLWSRNKIIRLRLPPEPNIAYKDQLLYLHELCPIFYTYTRHFAFEPGKEDDKLFQVPSRTSRNFSSGIVFYTELRFGNHKYTTKLVKWEKLLYGLVYRAYSYFLIFSVHQTVKMKKRVTTELFLL